MCRVAFLCLLAGVSLSNAGPLWPSATLPVTVLPVTVLLDFEQPHSSASFEALERELGRILTPARLKVDLRIRSEVPPSAQFGELVVFKMKGSCSMSALPIGALSDERGALAMTYSVDGQMLSFGAVECDRVRQSVQRVFGRGDPEGHQAAYGVALARVIAHEMYHMISNSSAHTKDGVTKRSLSGQELSQHSLTLAGEAANALRADRDAVPPR